jgi:hypothetical protein
VYCAGLVKVKMALVFIGCEVVFEEVKGLQGVCLFYKA